ncbi:MAG: hypothetical protein K8F92_09765 [Hyphomicrobium sp.]|uniref:hypothetical protein n=1 Tax=Hyphomicrobium sp. TaxID=82 RepID=UPI001323E33D|nr:hypothetical protein [Hyphomicrobium sp.]KAB2939987.1 MAG: hypothetical protein F9K20_15150 [Hyphomicrobium sp.]MBZ0209924.1 hypothetical protein [Hyphomicrobium sp.]
MHINRTVVLCAALIAFMAGAGRAENEPTGYACTFDMGTAWTFEDGAFESKAPEPISLTIADIDLERQTAQLVPEAGKVPGALKIVRAINANHFLEVVNEGFLNLTTIYDKDAASGAYPAVHSRHFGVLGQPVVAQYAGTCTAK